jgi:hypothetical protein
VLLETTVTDTPPTIHVTPRGSSTLRQSTSLQRPDVSELGERRLVSSLMASDSAFRAALERVFREPRPTAGPSTQRTRSTHSNSDSTASASSSSDYSDSEEEEEEVPVAPTTRTAAPPRQTATSHPAPAVRPSEPRLREISSLFEMHQLAQETIEVRRCF